MKQKQEIFTVLGGRVKMLRGKYNVTADAIFLAALVHGSPKTVLDVGIGTGGAALALLSRMPNVRATGIDISQDLLDECATNAELNGRNIELIHGDILKWRTPRTFDAVITNPPYFQGTARAGANVHHNVNLGEWTRACLKRVTPRGYFYCITDAAATSTIIAAIYTGGAGDIEIIPIFSGKDYAERVLIAARLGTKGGAKIHAGINFDNENILKNMGEVASS
ncbi:MAG: methyltransferase domain-containing protein [Alphaproteobacteria bacterium]|nr:methyltransferase domain-containing protein [Alphaproteobacteria bacterium]